MLYRTWMLLSLTLQLFVPASDSRCLAQMANDIDLSSKQASFITETNGLLSVEYALRSMLHMVM